MKALKFLPYFIIAGLIFLLILQKECTPKPTPKPTTTDTTIFKIDTVKITKVVYYPKPYKIIDSVFKFDTIFKTKYDTVKAVHDYSLYKKFDLQIIDDTSGKINALVDVQFNNIVRYEVKGNIYNKIIEKNHYVIEKKRNKVFAGVQFWYSIHGTAISAKPSLQLLTKKENLYSASYDHFYKIAEIGVFWKIKIK